MLQSTGHTLETLSAAFVAFPHTPSFAKICLHIDLCELRATGGKHLISSVGVLRAAWTKGEIRRPTHPRRNTQAAKTWPRPSLFTVGQPVFPTFVCREAHESGLSANWVILQESSRVGTAPTSLQVAEGKWLVKLGQGSPGRCARRRGDTRWGGLTAWPADLDGLTAGHGLGACLTQAFLPAEGHLVSNGERLPVRRKKKKFNTSSPESSVSIGDLTTCAWRSLVAHTAHIEHQLHSRAVPGAELNHSMRIRTQRRPSWAIYMIFNTGEITTLI